MKGVYSGARSNRREEYNRAIRKTGECLKESLKTPTGNPRPGTSRWKDKDHKCRNASHVSHSSSALNNRVA
jgi:hypothetical protein